jgi:membrane-associated protease RseP (regulator of RpoE activity)
LGYRVRSITIGVGPRLFHAQVRDTRLEVRLLPLGGYTKIGGKNSWRWAASASEPSGMSRLIRIAALNVAAVVLGGPAASLLLGAGLLCAYLALNGWRFARQDLDVVDDPRPLGGFLSIVFYGVKCFSLRPQAALLHIATLSLSLGATNLAPLFPLDGGYVPLAIYVAISGRRPDRNIAVTFVAAGALVLVSLMVWLLVSDIKFLWRRRRKRLLAQGSSEALATPSPAVPGEAVINESVETSVTAL